MIQLKSGHLIFDHKLIKDVFSEEDQVNHVYYPERKSFLIAPASKTFFKKMHETKWSNLKLKNLQGDKSLFIRDLIIDHEINDEDRGLTYDLKKTGFIEIELY
ncbi:hypothetical protein [Jiulongibacter sediminis]|uniref:Uncharacterized protein n=1 Tax=Jiulongibacter sediminis TaxID=1605367 RepID=A0A0P7BR62_9BACT|nr:hypothetical protein [Jiulongibacter sediminis]KPM49733.1 hypothetical protein AFM12_03890 [Jiulongibacter sediminis]TBX26770.1 hypothetical protein TK44_03895 [Jiulongibacter sediminis]